LPASQDLLEVDLSRELYRKVKSVGLPDIGKLLLIAGVVFAIVGGVLVIASRLGFGGLPGDISVDRGNFSFVFPIVTCIVVSIVLTVILNIILRLRG
jgi:hypothetical protein